MTASQPIISSNELPSAAALTAMVPAGRYEALGTSSTGLQSGEVARRLARYGPNDFSPTPREAGRT